MNRSTRRTLEWLEGRYEHLAMFTTYPWHTIEQAKKMRMTFIVKRIDSEPFLWVMGTRKEKVGAA